MLENPGPDGPRAVAQCSVHRGHDAAGGDHQLCRRAVFLLSPASSFVNGQVLFVHVGMSHYLPST